MTAKGDDQAWIVAHEFMQQIVPKYEQPQVKFLEYVTRCIQSGHALVYTRKRDDSIEATAQKMRDLSQIITRLTNIADFPVVDVGSRVEVRASSNVDDIVAKWPH
ncbi:hypothetical protein HY417_03480 [Candidatus Kaiserbacteria bacterium]|nr:hypothetical protein [Candidatus Kaiserbacteria bacterium]